jgi:hypothetical protein
MWMLHLKTIMGESERIPAFSTMLARRVADEGKIPMPFHP